MPSARVTLPCRFALLDIEGTVSPLAFVRDVMFPYAGERLEAFVESHWGEPALQEVTRQISADCPGVKIENSVGLTAACKNLMARDAKATGLKALQGMIWDDGFRSGAIRPPLFPDVPDTLRSWKAAGLGLGIYSSGSIGAQVQFFRHTEAGDLTHLFSRHFDTTTGPKKEASSYAKISQILAYQPDEIAFFSDVVAELDAARSAGMRTVFLDRPGNAPESPGDHPAINSLELVQWRSA